MGETTGVNNRSYRQNSGTNRSAGESGQAAPSPVRAATSTAKPLRLRLDVPFLVIITSLLAFGLLMVYSASLQPSIQAEGTPYYFFLNQLKWAAVGIALATIAMYIDYRRLKPLIVPMIIVTLLLLVAVLIFGEYRLGARRSFSGGSVQPSEFAKPAIIMYLAYWLNAKKDLINNFSMGLMPLLSILGIIAGLILLQPDISAAATIIILGILLFFLAGGNFRQIVTVGVVTVLVGLLMVTLNNTLSDTGSNRITDWWGGLQNPELASDHIQRSIESIVRGGVFGVGLGRGTTKFTGLPVAHTDSIFAVIAEELGILGAALVIIMFILFAWRGIKISLRATDLTGKLIASGLTLWIFLEAVINMGVMVNIFPFAGNALPFFSSGGSSLISTLISVGLIMNVARVSSGEQSSSNGRSYGAVADLRWRDGGRRVSRPRRSTESR